MHAIKTVQAKNGQTYYYVSGKRISAKAAQEIMNAPAAPAPTLAIVKDVESDALFAEQAKKTAPKKLAPSNTALGYLQRTVKAQRPQRPTQTKRVTRARNNLLSFVHAAIITLILLTLLIIGFDFNAEHTIKMANTYLIVCVPVFLMLFKRYQKAKDTIANQI